MDDEAVIGICTEMCPLEERCVREREGLLHRFEILNNSDFGDLKNSKKADPEKTIKCFSRSAAGLTMHHPNILRPAPVLLKTVQYLMQNIAPRFNDQPLDVYEFTTDRLRAVRQDMTIQRLQPHICVAIMEPIIRYHVFYGYILSTHPRFDSYLNTMHIQECLTKILEIYKAFPECCQKYRLLIEEIFVCVNIDNPTLVLRKLNDFNFRSTVSWDLLLAWAAKNYVRIFRLAKKLHVLPLCALALHIPALRLQALRSYCHAMSCQNSAYPIQKLVTIFSYNSTCDLLNDCRLLGISFSDLNCHFNKKYLAQNLASCCAQRWWVADDALAGVDISLLFG